MATKAAPSLVSTATLGEASTPGIGPSTVAPPRDILDRPIIRREIQVSASAIEHLFSAIVQYSLSKDRHAIDFEGRLHEMGIRVGQRVLLIVSLREKQFKRDIKVVPLLTFIAQNCWKYLFDHTCDLYKGQDSESEYLMNDKCLTLTKFINPPIGSCAVNCGAFAAGIIEGILCSADIPGSVTAHVVPDPKTNKNVTTFLIKLMPEVFIRENAMNPSNSTATGGGNLFSM